MEESTDGRFVARWQIAAQTGAVVVVEVVRAFATAAYAFAAGRSERRDVDQGVTRAQRSLNEMLS